MVGWSAALAPVRYAVGLHGTATVFPSPVFLQDRSFYIMNRSYLFVPRDVGRGGRLRRFWVGF